MNEQIAVLLIVGLIGGVLAGCIAYARQGNSGQAFWLYFIFGLLFPLIGIIVAAVAKPAHVQQVQSSPGWYADPWRQGRAAVRWFDGAQWTPHFG